jgi:hypothetical protein
MDQTAVRRVKIAWFVGWVAVVIVAIAGWGSTAAMVAGMGYVAASILAVTAFVLNLIMGEEPPVWRFALIALFIGGLLVEVGGIASALRLHELLPR